MTALTAARVRELLHYDPETGIFTWKPGANAGKGHGKRVAGGVAGCAPSGKRRYPAICIDRTVYLSHRLAWLYMTAAWPEATVDHEDRDTANNRWANLRGATQAEQVQNSRISRRNKSGHKGVCWDESKRKWLAQISAGGRHFHLGRYDDPSVAAAAYQAAKADKHRFHPTV